MSDQPNFNIDPQMIFAAIQQQSQEQTNHNQMHSADFRNRWHDMLKNMPLEQLSTIEELLGVVTSGDGAVAIGHGNFFEGQCHAALVLRGEEVTPLQDYQDEEAEPSVPFHLFRPDADDLYCIDCGLPLANQVHVK